MVAHQACRTFGDFVPLAEVEMHLHCGWGLLDDLANDPLGASHVLMAPPVEGEAA